jgi:hypothetical protein
MIAFPPYWAIKRKAVFIGDLSPRGKGSWFADGWWRPLYPNIKLGNPASWEINFYPRRLLASLANKREGLRGGGKFLFIFNILLICSQRGLKNCQLAVYWVPVGEAPLQMNQAAIRPAIDPEWGHWPNLGCFYA